MHQLETSRRNPSNVQLCRTAWKRIFAGAHKDLIVRQLTVSQRTERGRSNVHRAPGTYPAGRPDGPGRTGAPGMDGYASMFQGCKRR